MELKLNVNMDNAAFQGPGHEEVSRILREISQQIEHSYEPHPSGGCMDINGNTVGTWEITEESENPLVQEIADKLEGWGHAQCSADLVNAAKRLRSG